MGLEIKTTHKLTCNHNELTSEMLADFVRPLEHGTKIKVQVLSGRQPDPTTVSFEAEVDIDRGRIY